VLPGRSRHGSHRRVASPYAAICRSNNAVCATRNTKDFVGTGIDVVDPGADRARDRARGAMSDVRRILRPMEDTTPRIADILYPWLTAYAAERTGRRRERILDVATRAIRCLKTEADRIATDPERHLIELERQFDSPDPVGRAIGCDALPDLLLLMTTDAWLPTDPHDRRVQLQVLGAFGRWLASPHNGWFASYCSVLTLQVEVDRLRASDRQQVEVRHQKEHH
jgi:hypothetical protein